MSQEFDFGQLVELCRRTHEETQRSAARAADTYLVTRNWLFVWYIVEYEQRGADRAKYGARLLAKVSHRLQEAGIKGCSTTHLKLCRQFHQQQKQIGQTLSDQLASPASAGQISPIGPTPSDLIKNPLVLEFLGLEEKPAYSETDLETAIIDRLQNFLLELGKGFLFEARQKRFTFDNSHFFVDLVFYNRLLRCYVLIDLKRGELTHQDLGQMQMYVNYFDRYVKTEAELPTIGMVLCSGKNDAMVELTTLPKDANIYASQYQLYLPSKQELKAQLESIRREFIVG